MQLRGILIPGGSCSVRFTGKVRYTIVLCLIVFVLSTGAFPAGQMTSTILIGNSRIDVVVEGGKLETSKEDLLKWVQWAAESVSTYYGHFPVPHLSLRIVPFDGKGVRGGRTFEKDGGFISIHVGSNSSFAELSKDWMLTHEMVHLSFPSVAENHHWIEEGIATYVEPIARVRAKHMDAAEMWREVVRDLHQGLPAEGDKGLDNTHTWGRTYWGGALFCFLADVEIHRETGNRKGLEDALRGILNAGGDITKDWRLEKTLDTGDRATGVPVLRSLYEKMKDQPYSVDLPAIWTQLGIVQDGEKVRFVDDAPLAKTRDAITYGTSPSSLGADAAQPAFSAFAGRTKGSPAGH
jgi:hypothetical protein